MSESAYITGISKFLPNEPVENNNIENFIGMVGGKPSRAKNIVLRHNKIKQRYYALDQRGISTHSNSELAANAVKALFRDMSEMNGIDLLATATTTPDQMIPSHASMVHGELKCKEMEIASVAGSCCTGMQALKVAWTSILAGEAERAVAVASEKPSSWMLSKHFEYESEHLSKLVENPMIAFEKDFLRFMVSDGAGAFLIENQPTSPISLKIDWISISSFANKFDTCMYSGAEKNGHGSLKSWTDFEPSDWVSRSVFSIKQDVRLLNDNIVPTAISHLVKVLDSKGFDISEIDYFLPHMSSEYFRTIIESELIKNNLLVPKEKWFTNLTEVGNIGSASIYVILEELFHLGNLKKGQKILALVPESARFTYAFMLLTVV